MIKIAICVTCACLYCMGSIDYLERYLSDVCMFTCKYDLRDQGRSLSDKGMYTFNLYYQDRDLSVMCTCLY